MTCVLCGRSILDVTGPRNLTVLELSLPFCQDADGCRRTALTPQVRNALALGATPETVAEALAVIRS